MAKKLFKYITIVFLSLSSITILLIWQVEHMPFHDSVLVTLMLFGAGEPLNLPVNNLSWITSIFVVGQTISGLAVMTMAFGLLADFIMSDRIARMIRKREKIKMKDHVILCGLGNVGYRVVQELERMNQELIVIDRGDEKDFVELVRKKHKIIIDNLKHEDVLKQANIAEAKSLIICTGNDLLNMEVALNARSYRKDLTIVMRVFDQNLAGKVAEAFHVKVAFSSSELAAPVFAAASFDRTVFRSVRIENRLFVSAQIKVESGSALADMTLEELCVRDLAILKLITGEKRLIFPVGKRKLLGGDCLFITCTMETLDEVKKLNEVG